jgi:hypothetical protein
MVRYLDTGRYIPLCCAAHTAVYCGIWHQILTSFLIRMITRKCWSSGLFPVYLRDQEWSTKVSSAVKCEVAVGCCFTDTSHTQLQIKKVLSPWNSSDVSFFCLIVLKLWMIRNANWDWGRGLYFSLIHCANICVCHNVLKYLSLSHTHTHHRVSTST